MRQGRGTDEPVCERVLLGHGRMLMDGGFTFNDDADGGDRSRSWSVPELELAGVAEHP